ncbi:putative bifunctional diguanylate cyclase/phosphodiesterase [Paenibacillus sp.]|uniref:putative bifunctional diguanylate cyclase/phosphodiesterase n=1 Tax=Paenibacillus sp. TaxID=58172 RepID=UPI002D542655|nr:EAL domain-containing protein [Paenibacillus sp.]HZG58481.1 EAL domain-containing protein [Paenibacillus sp.]
MRILRELLWIPYFLAVGAVHLAAFLFWLATGDLSSGDAAFAWTTAICFGAALVGAAFRLRSARRAETEIERRLQQKEEVFSSLFDSIPVAISLLDRTGAFVRTNPASEQITGYSIGDVAGKSFSEFVHVNHMNETMRRFRQTLDGEVQTFHSVLVLNSGYPADVQVTALPIKDDKQHITGIIAIYEDITKKRQTEERIKHMAYYDDLTGLPNRRLFRDLVAEYLLSAGDRTRIYVMLLNVDRFKVVNGSLGQDIGDMLLLQLADRLHRAVADHGAAARMEGDEFGILYRDSGGSVLPGELARRITKELDEPFLIQEYTLHISTSMGIAAGYGGGDESLLLKNAGVALSKAKEKGKNSFELYTPEMEEQYLSKFTLENDLRKAIQEGEFLLLYQPQYHIVTGDIVGTEALIRWKHPERGIVSPAEFIPIAEETGLIVPLSEWVFREACQQNRAWQREGLPPIPVSVNLSVRQFLHPNLIERVASILKESELSAEYLELEITESMTMDVEFATAALLRLKELGLRISIDDFGTGYSSLNYLKSFPVDKLKIDRSFVRDIMVDPNDAAIVRTIITMAHHLNQTVIAEGVETEEQLSYLRTYGCDEMQGYLYSPPVPPERLRELLRERQLKSG